MIQYRSKVKFIGSLRPGIDKNKIYTIETTINRTIHTRIKLLYICRENPESRFAFIADESELELIE